MLCIFTDLKDIRWLQYILREFTRINLAEFPIQVNSIEQSEEKKEDIIYYIKNNFSDICIPNRSYVYPKDNIKWISEKVFIIEDTIVNDRRASFPYDIFWNAFVFLSRFEEYLSENNGKKIQSYSNNHHRRDKSTFDVPVVNHLFDELEHLIKRHFPKLPFGHKKRPVVELSHDVDYIEKTIQLRLKQTGINAFNALKGLTNPKLFARQTLKTAKFFFSSPSYWCFDYWIKLEKSFKMRSVYYVYANASNKNYTSLLLDPSYDIRNNKMLKNKLKELIQNSFEIGLHGSIQSATDKDRLHLEKRILEDTIQIQVDKVRQHWLKYEEKITPYLHNNLFKYDSTLGWNDRVGFRSGCASRYRPYDHVNQKSFNYLIIPQVIMDSNIFEYGAIDVKLHSKKALEIIDGLQQFKKSHISISWHQRSCNSDYTWHKLYEEILERGFCRQRV